MPTLPTLGGCEKLESACSQTILASTSKNINFCNTMVYVPPVYKVIVSDDLLSDLTWCLLVSNQRTLMKN